MAPFDWPRKPPHLHLASFDWSRKYLIYTFAQKPLSFLKFHPLYKFKILFKPNPLHFHPLLHFLKNSNLSKISLFLKANPRSPCHLKNRNLDFGIVRVIAENQVGISARPELVETPNDRSRWVSLLTKTSNILSILVLIDHVTLCYKNPIFIHSKQPPQNLDF